MRSPADVAARIRGAFTGSAAGAVSIAAHGLGGAGMPLDQTAIVLLIAACTATGALSGSLRTRHGIAEVMAMLVFGQALGHTALSVSAHGHEHSATALMLVAHLMAVLVGALLIHGAELAVRYVLASMRGVFLALDPVLPVPDELARPILRTTVPRRLPILVSSGIGRRGPPSPR